MLTDNNAASSGLSSGMAPELTEEIMSRPGGGPGTNRIQAAVPDATQR